MRQLQGQLQAIKLRLERVKARTASCREGFATWMPARAQRCSTYFQEAPSCWSSSLPEQAHRADAQSRRTEQTRRVA